MAIFDEQQKTYIAKALTLVKNIVKISYFTQEMESTYCTVTREMLTELSALSPKIDIKIYDLVKDLQLAEKFKIDKIPATIIHKGDGSGIRFFGVPAGYEFQSLLEDIITVGNNESPLSLEAILEIGKIKTPLHIEVIVSPTCPYCPAAVSAAHKFAMANPNITSDMVEISEFPHIAVKYAVKGVPHTVINGRHNIVGVMPELEMAREINKLLAKA